VYDAGLGARVRPVTVPTPAVGSTGSTVPIVGGPSDASGSSSAALGSDATGLLTQIMTALVSANANQTPVLNNISSNTGLMASRLGRLSDAEERLIVELRQIAHAAA